MLPLRLTLWLDHNHAAYWTGAIFASGVFFVWVLAGLRHTNASPAPRESPWPAAAILALLLAAWRWPLWFFPASFNPDEGLLVAGAQALAHDPVFWRSVDGSTAGPLNFYALLWVKLAGAPVNFLTARLTGLLLVWGTLCFSYRLLRLFHACAPARLALVPVALFLAIVTQDDFVHYSTEHVALCLFAGATFLLVRRQQTGAGGNAAWWVGGAGLGLLPWAKLQSIPLGAAVVVWLGFMLWRDAGLPDAEKRRRFRNLLLAGVTPSLLVLVLIVAVGVWPYFLESYVLQNFHYVGANTSAAYLWNTLTRTLNLTWHFQACLAGPALVIVVGSLLDRPRRMAFNAAWLLGLALVLSALFAVLAPRRPFAHYLLFLLPPVLLWSGAVIGDLWNRLQPAGRRWLAVLCLLSGAALPLTLRFSQPVPAMLDQLAAARVQPLTAAGNLVRAYAHPGDQLGIWGSMSDLNVESGLSQATRLGNSMLCIQSSPQFDYYRQGYLADLQRNRPALFVDATGPTAEFFTQRPSHSHETFPALAAFVRENYVEVTDLDYARIYVRTDRFEAAKLDARQLRALADAGRPVRWKLGPEPLALDHAGLQGNMIGGRFVRMMLPRAEISWPLRGDEREFYFESGYDPRAYLEGDGNGTLFTAELALPVGAVLPVYNRLLDPVHREADRGVVRDRFPLPPVPPGAKLILRTSPGPLENAAWDWAYLASAAFDHSPGFTHRQFPGFNRLPEATTQEVAYFETENDRSVLAIHAPASLTFRLHGGERSVAFDYGLRSGTYSNGGNTDGAGYRVTLRRAGQPEAVVFERLLQPVAQAADQGTQHAEFSLPEGIEAGTELVLTISPGPQNNSSWDWTYMANLQIR